ncbi:PIN domain-containing protein [Zavarzinella formosa]|uniref:PIN domain-containing protein n=1 Tax=Zavarzinella formosa TaxID=360055 RepID=UPI00030A7FBC|nr:PIN domain-containing protein [Zavarzinella formosa]
MSDDVVLDSGPLGVLCNPNRSAQPLAIRTWLAAILASGRRVIIPEIADYEVRREFLRNQSQAALKNLDTFGKQIEYLPLTTAAMRLAAELWAQVRNAGLATAHQQALDGDVILAAQALTLGSPLIVATGNLSHISRFVPAGLWQNITP